MFTKVRSGHVCLFTASERKLKKLKHCQLTLLIYLRDPDRGAASFIFMHQVLCLLVVERISKYHSAVPLGFINVNSSFSCVVALLSVLCRLMFNSALFG